MPIKERRKFMRIATTLEAEYWAKGPSMLAGHGEIRDLSRGGMRMFLPNAVQPGEHVDVTLRVPGDNVPILTTAEVTWVQPVKGQTKVGAGLRFLSIRPLDMARLLDFVYSRWLGGVRESF